MILANTQYALLIFIPLTANIHRLVWEKFRDQERVRREGACRYSRGDDIEYLIDTRAVLQNTNCTTEDTVWLIHAYSSFFSCYSR